MKNESRDGFILNYSSLADFLFVIIPILIVLFVNLFKYADWFVKTFCSPEFGVASCIVIGQSLAKYAGLISGLSGVDKKRAVFVASVLVGLLIISMVFLVFALISNGGNGWVYVGQIIFFVAASVIHFYVGYFEEEIDDEIESESP